MNKRVILLVSLLILLGFWNFLNYSGFFLTTHGTIFSLPARFLFSNVCHLDSHKLFVFDGLSTILCSRCSGIYTGAMLTGIVLLFVDIRIHFKLRYLFYFLVPVMTDVILYNSGVYDYNIFIAFTTGLFSGIFGFYYFYFSILIYITEKAKR